MRFFLSLFLISFSFAATAQASPLVADISNYHIDIDARFIGTRLFLFGSRNENGDVIVVVRGPEKHFTVRRKERVAGIWLNRKYVSFKPAADFYAIASSRPLEALEHYNLKQQLGIGLDTLLDVQDMASRKLNAAEFREALLQYQRKRRLYGAPASLQFMGDTLFKTTVEFPDTIARGNYTAEVYLLQNDQLIAMQSIPITVSKVGFDGAISALAHDAPWLYGFLAISLALLAGWTANQIFAKK